jgi:hypothetical protein
MALIGAPLFIGFLIRSAMNGNLATATALARPG